MHDAGVDIEVEFKAATQALLSNHNEGRVETLLSKSKLGPLSHAEKVELQQLLSRSGV